EFTGPLARSEESRRAQESPVQVLHLPQRIQEGLARGGFGLVCGREMRRVQQDLPGGDLEARRSAHDEVALDAGAPHQVDELVRSRVRALEPQRADDDVVTL